MCLCEAFSARAISNFSCGRYTALQTHLHAFGVGIKPTCMCSWLSQRTHAYKAHKATQAAMMIHSIAMLAKEI